MKTTQKIATLMAAAIIAVVFMFGNALHAQQAKQKPWPVPEKDKALKAPAKADLATGKELWAKHCKSCHGSKGLGDGPKAASLKTESGDFSSAAFQAGTDGEIFYRTNKGRDEMPAYEKKIPDANDRWALVAFMRTFKK
ncbi:MAG: cytochrome c [Bacteroidales bacterium]|nr:cytochrome c [Bacteroidales bacterium]